MAMRTVISAVAVLALAGVCEGNVCLGEKTIARNARYSAGSCKKPQVIPLALQDDVRGASPFYVMATTKSPKTADIDNICYTYFEDGDQFINVLSVVFSDCTTSEQYVYNKYDIKGKTGIAETIELTAGNCSYHDYTLPPICDNTLFDLYRCFVHKPCENIDTPPVDGADVRLFLAAEPTISDSCKKEVKEAFRGVHPLKGGEVIFLPYKCPTQCVNRYSVKSVNADKVPANTLFAASQGCGCD